MFSRALLSFLVSLFGAIACMKHVEKKEPATEPEYTALRVTSPSGVFKGSWMETRRGKRFEAYRGIRYAEPPVAELRFQPPKPILNYKDEVDASEEGPACPLLAPDSYYTSEDCLRINVYTPRTNSSKLLPVIFYIHAGGFFSMAGRSDLAGPHYLLERDVVLVTINYRIGALGFLSTGDELAPGNNGMKDQVAALRWVQRNIAAFGGDPGLVTIAGCSAGSISVMLHMVSPMSKGLFHRAISMSGSHTRMVTANHQRHLAERQAEIVGCPTNTTRQLVDCLKTTPWKELGKSLPGFYKFGYDTGVLWSPVIELDFGQERYLPVDPTEAIRLGQLNTVVPHLISQTHDEFFWVAYHILRNESLLHTMNTEWERVAPISFLYDREQNTSEKSARLHREYIGDRALANDADSEARLGRLYADAIMGFPIYRMANLMSMCSPEPVYYYEFAYIGNHSHYEDPITKKPVGAAHHDDLIYLFTLSYAYPTIPLGSRDDQIVDKMTAIWYNFARYGNPNPRGSTPELGDLAWPVMTSTKREYLRIGEDFSIHSKYGEERFKIWDELEPLKPLSL